MQHPYSNEAVFKNRRQFEKNVIASRILGQIVGYSKKMSQLYSIKAPKALFAPGHRKAFVLRSVNPQATKKPPRLGALFHGGEAGIPFCATRKITASR